MTSISLAPPGPARRAAFGKILQNEARLTWRRPIALIAGVALPQILLVVFGEVGRTPMAALRGLTILDLYVPILSVFTLALLAFLGLPMPLTAYRELGVLRRLSTTPVPRSWLLAAQGLVQLCTAAAALLLLFVTADTAFGALPPRSPAGLAISVALSIAGFFPIGLLIAAIARTANAASVIGRLVFIPMMFFGGLWLPRALMPTVLLDISNYTPVGAAVQAIQDSTLQGFPPVAPLLVLAAYAVVFGYLARRFFRWE